MSVLNTALKALIVVAFSGMVVSALLQVASRYVFNSPLGWTEELAKFLMVWWTFLTVGLLSWQGRLLGIDAALLTMGPRSAHLTSAAAQAVSAIVIGWLSLLGIRLVELAGDQITPALDVPYAWIYLSLPVGLGFATTGFVYRAIYHVKEATQRDVRHPIVVLERTDT
jgi:TRAP-type C4-dicarboxylate transport system permease small subunit